MTSLFYCAIYAQLLVLRSLGGASYRTGIILVVVRMAAPPATTSSEYKLNKVMYTILYNLHCKNVYLSPWIRYVSSIFQNSGSNYIWLTQDCNIDAKIIFKSECDQFMQLWHSRIINRDNDHNVTYSLFKLSHGRKRNVYGNSP